MSYAIFVIAGLLKFYPFVLLATSIRERPRVFALVAAVAAVIISSFVFVHWDEILKVLSLQPRLVFWGDTFGARKLPYGLADYFGMSSVAEIPVWLLMMTVFGFVAFRLGGRVQPVLERTPCDRQNSHFLILGSVLMVGCFFAGVNVGYRALYLLFVLPGLFELTSQLEHRTLKRVLKVTLCAIFFVLWKDFFQHGVDKLFGPFNRSPPYLGFFLLHELSWWWVIAVLSVFVGLFVVKSPLWRAVNAALNRVRSPKPN